MNNFLEILEARLADKSDVYLNARVDADVYLAELAEDVRRNECNPFEVSAVVMAPGLPEIADGEQITGLCVAHSDGRWLIYRPEDDLFYAFWGTSQECLGAHGVFGSPLYCWSA